MDCDEHLVLAAVYYYYNKINIPILKHKFSDGICLSQQKKLIKYIHYKYYFIDRFMKIYARKLYKIDV